MSSGPGLSRTAVSPGAVSPSYWPWPYSIEDREGIGLGKPRPRTEPVHELGGWAVVAKLERVKGTYVSFIRVAGGKGAGSVDQTGSILEMVHRGADRRDRQFCSWCQGLSVSLLFGRRKDVSLMGALQT